MLDKAVSEQLAQQIGATPQNCFANAVTGLSRLDGWRYIEGFCVDPDGSLFEHGWIERNGVIIDPTLYHDPPIAYYTGTIYTRAEVDAVFAADESVILPLWYCRPAGKPAMRRAQDLAIAHSSQILEQLNAEQ